MNKLVSVIIPCYNQAKYLPDALDSIHSQTYQTWECIIVNDGSSDNTKRIAQAWTLKDSRFKYIEKKNGGLSSARNAGLEIAVGEYIQFLDADDILEKNKIRHQMAYLENSDEIIDVIVSGYRYFHDADEKREFMIFGPGDILPEVIINKEDKRDLVKLFAKRNPMVVSAPLYHRSIFKKVGNFDENLGANEDWDFHFRCAINGIVFQHCGYSPGSKTLIRIHSRSMTMDRKNMRRNLWKFMNKHRGHYEFANENGLLITGSIQLIKMLTPPILSWLLRRFYLFIFR